MSGQVDGSLPSCLGANDRDQAWKSAASLGADPNHVFAIGESAGGCLALAVTNALIAKGDRKKVQGVVALCPVTTHPHSVPATHKDIYNSRIENGSGVPVISSAVLDTFTRTAHCEAADSTCFITLSKNLKEFPPTHIVTAGKDPLRDDGRILEAMLKNNGVAVQRSHFDGFPHVFWIFPMCTKRDEAMADAVEGISFVLLSGKKRGANIN
jgi:versiconal hemiacetal acetate esterase